MKIGNYKCTIIEMDRFYLDGGAMFGVVPKVLWEKKIPSDSMNRIPMSTRTMLIQGDGRNILVDTGIGEKFGEKEKEIYGIKDQKSMDSRLEQFGISCDDITDVILTHLHFDHAGGATKIENNKVVPTFKNASYHVQIRHLEKALNPTPRDRASFINDNFQVLLNKNILKTVDGPVEIFDGIELIISNGHTDFQQHPLIRGDGQSLFYCGDLFPTSAHIPINWHMGYDNNPLVIIEEKRKILEKALKEKWILVFEHDPFVQAATLKKGKNKIEIDQLVEV